MVEQDGGSYARHKGHTVLTCAALWVAGTNLLWEGPLFSKTDPRQVHPHPQERTGDPFF